MFATIDSFRSRPIPPRHTKFRMALNPIFSPGALRPLAPDFEALAKRIVGDDASPDTEKYVLLGFVSANHDPERFENPAEINFERERNAHIAFGFGPHSCLGQNITEIETVAFLKGILPELASWKFATEPNLVWVDEPLADGSTTRYLDKFKEIRITSA